MLNHRASLSIPRGLAVLRSSRVGTRVVGPVLRPVLRAPSLSSTCVYAASLFTISRRWCSAGGLSGHVPTPPNDLPAKTPSPVAAGEAHTGLAAPDTPAAAATSVAEQLKVLSAEDQLLILDALQAPEKVKSSVMGGAGIGPADGDMVAAFTCGPCEYRMVKRFSKHAYTKGIVIVECPNCRAKHLLADNLGWMEDTATNIEDILKTKGQSFIRIGGTEGDYQVMDSAATGSATSCTPPQVS
ncbi:hypothetical protein JKF63_04581 [Porcisia hertigi]|uniref:DNL-type domain-containing protein n=1 Tax=Porcisia hertigi TaxID=2761500 RepID=A0A836ITK7_9TRYP|nr:hypothetical protein JKF63_04581 [Porcisia hertigi]